MRFADSAIPVRYGPVPPCVIDGVSCTNGKVIHPFDGAGLAWGWESEVCVYTATLLEVLVATKMERLYGLQPADA